MPIGNYRKKNFDAKGERLDLFSGEVLASNGLIHDEMMAVLAFPSPLRL